MIVLDLMMPEVNGFDVVAALSEQPETAHLAAKPIEETQQPREAEHQGQDLGRLGEAGSRDGHDSAAGGFKSLPRTARLAPASA